MFFSKLHSLLAAAFQTLPCQFFLARPGRGQGLVETGVIAPRSVDVPAPPDHGVQQARGETVDTRSDMFSAAAVMYELFTSEKLFPGDEAEDIIRNIAEMPLPKPSQVRPGLPPRLDDILHHALARLPDQRPARPAVASSCASI